MESFRLVNVDYANINQTTALVELLELYATDIMGGKKRLKAEVRKNLPLELARFPGALSILCYYEDVPVGLANCFLGFSTFNARPLLNIHDMIVIKAYRGLGISQLLLKKAQEYAKEKGCIKMTLEVLEGNLVAQKSYEKFGFKGYELDSKMGHALFWEMPL